MNALTLTLHTTSALLYLLFEVLDHLLYSKGSIGKQANVIFHTTVTRGNEVRQAEVRWVILLSLLPQSMESATS